jgi:hypothetical protein
MKGEAFCVRMKTKTKKLKLKNYAYVTSHIDDELGIFAVQNYHVPLRIIFV